MLRLKKRAEFLAAARGARVSRRGFVLQAIARTPADERPARVGFTVTKKVGNAVVRNRIKRRLRELARLTGSACFHAGHDYVLIGRRGALRIEFEQMRQDLTSAIADAAAGKVDKPRFRSKRPKGSGHKSRKATTNRPAPSQKKS